MNTQLIPVFAGELSGTPTQLIDARLLHSFLDVGKKFSDWIRDRISQYGFQENQDFVCVSQKQETQRASGQKGVSVIIDYHLTLDMAKELSMVERNDKGKQARRYFIACEKAAQHTVPADLTQQIAALQAELLKANPRLDDVLKLTRSGYSQPRIADMLHIGSATVYRDAKRLRDCGFVVCPDTALVAKV